MTRYYIQDLIWNMCMGIPIYIVVRGFILLGRIGRTNGGTDSLIEKLKSCNKLREVCLGLFVVFMMALLTFVWQGYYGNPIDMIRVARMRLRTREGINCIPFHTIRNYYRAYGVKGDMFSVNIFGNILMFVPWGFGLLLLWEKNRSLIRLIFFSAVLPIVIEGAQLFIGRQVDVDDFLLNFLGALLGGILFWILSVIFPKLKTIAL